MTDTAYGFNVNVTVTCTPLSEKLDAWKIDTYEKITQAYYAMKRQHDDELAALSMRSGVQIEGLSPAQNAEMSRLEIKKAIIEMLTVTNFTQHFEGRNAVERKDSDGKPIAPRLDLQKALQSASEIQFIEQAFEWENMTYVLYPYFWTSQDQWDQLADLTGPDPEFANFLRAGSARVILPARPKFEHQARLYVETGIMWGGGPVPAPGEEDYLSIADEIRAMEKSLHDGIRGESWEVSLPTSLVWLDTQNNRLPVENPHITLDLPPGKVQP